MGLKREEKALLSLLKVGLWEKNIVDFSLFPLSEKEWEELFRISRTQTVTGLVYRGLIRLPEALLPPQQLLFRWVAQIDAIENRNRKMNHTLHDFYSIIEKNHFFAVLQKGQGVAAMYEYPLLRECGDIDIFFPIQQERDATYYFLTNQNSSPVIQQDGSYNIRWEGCEFEFHPTLLDFQDPFLKKYLSGLIKEKGFSEEVISDNQTSISVTIPSPLLMLLLLNVHILKHALGTGIGLRHLCDMARAYYTLCSKVEAKELQSVYKKTGIEKWSMLLHTFLVEFLGLNPDFIPGFVYDQTVSSVSLLDIILKGGNFGQHRATVDQHSMQRSWRKKLHTFHLYYKNRYLGLQYAPREFFWIVIKLIGWQFRLK